MPVSVDAKVDVWVNADWFDAMAMLASLPAFNKLDTGTEVEDGWIIPATAMAIREISAWDNLNSIVLHAAFDKDVNTTGGGSVWLTVMPPNVVLSIDNSRRCTLTMATWTMTNTCHCYSADLLFKARAFSFVYSACPLYIEPANILIGCSGAHVLPFPVCGNYVAPEM